MKGSYTNADKMAEAPPGPLFHVERPAFRGADFDPAKDRDRLGKGYRLTVAAMSDGWWRSKPAIRFKIASSTGETVVEESIGRYLRYAREDGWKLDRRRVTGGLYEYRITKGGENGPR